MTSPETKTPRVDMIALRHEGKSMNRNESNAQFNDLLDLARALERENNELRADAERYRYLRSKAKRSLMTSKTHNGDIQVIQWADCLEANVLSLDRLDAAIDAARAR